MTLREELEQLPPDLAATGIALAEFARSLCPGEFKLQNGQWIFRVHNFIAITVRYKRARHIAVSLSGYWADFRRLGYSEILGENDGRWSGYTVFKIDSPRQLKAAAIFIERAFENYAAGHPTVRALAASSNAPRYPENGIRINLLAEDLGIESKAILAKLGHEGLGDKAPNHMSTLPSELAQRVRGWFGGHSSK